MNKIKSRIIAWFKNHPKIAKALIHASLAFIVTFLGVVIVFSINNAMLQFVKEEPLPFMIWFTWAGVGWITGIGASWLLQRREDKRQMNFVKREISSGAERMKGAIDAEMKYTQKRFQEEVAANVEHIVNNIGKEFGFQVKLEDVEDAVNGNRENFSFKETPKNFRQN